MIAANGERLAAFRKPPLNSREYIAVVSGGRHDESRQTGHEQIMPPKPMTFGVALEPKEDGQAVEVGQYGGAPCQRDNLPAIPAVEPQRQCTVDSD